MLNLLRSFGCAFLLLPLLACSGPVEEAPPTPKTTRSPARAKATEKEPVVAEKKPAAPQGIDKTKVPPPRTREKGVATAKKAGTAGNSRVTLKGHASPISCVAFSRDGKTLVSGSWDQTVKVWDVATGKAITTFKGHGDDIVAVAVGPDGKTVVSVGLDKNVRVWDAKTGKEKAAIPVDSPGTLALSPDGKTLALSGEDAFSLSLWETETGKNIGRFEGPKDVRCRAFSPDGKTLASVGDDKAVTVYEVATGKVKGSYMDHLERIFGVAFSPDGKTIASGDSAGSVVLWEAATGMKKASLDNDNGVASLAFGPEGKTLAVGLSNNAGAALWDLTTNKQTNALDSFSQVSSMAFSTEGLLALGTHNKTIILFNTVAPKK